MLWIWFAWYLKDKKVEKKIAKEDEKLTHEAVLSQVLTDISSRAKGEIVPWDGVEIFSAMFTAGFIQAH